MAVLGGGQHGLSGSQVALELAVEPRWGELDSALVTEELEVELLVRLVLGPGSLEQKA